MNSGGDGTAPVMLFAIGRNICGLFATFEGKVLMKFGRRESPSCELYFRLVPTIWYKSDGGSEHWNGKDWSNSMFYFIKWKKNLIFALFSRICCLFASPNRRGCPIVNRRSRHGSAQQSGWWRGQTAVICICHRNFHHFTSGFGHFIVVLLLAVVLWVCWVHFWTRLTFPNYIWFDEINKLIAQNLQTLLKI